MKVWTEFTDEEQGPFSTKRTCFRCLQKIEPGAKVVQRRGKLDGERKTVNFHVDCVPEEEPAAEEADAVTSPPETTPLKTAAEASPPATDDAAPPADQAAEPGAEDPPAGLTSEVKKDLNHLAEIKARNRDVLAKFFEWEAAHSHAAAIKKELEAMRKDLNQFIARGVDPQQELEFGDDEGGRPFTALPDGAQPSANQPEWKSRSLDVLGLPAKVLSKLAEAAIETLGHLSDFWNSGRTLTGLKGVGPESQAKIGDAWAAYGKEHPEIYGEEESEGADAADAFDADDEAAAESTDEPADSGLADDNPFKDDEE